MNKNIKEGIRIALSRLFRGVTGVTALGLVVAVIISCTLSVTRQELAAAETKISDMLVASAEADTVVIKNLLNALGEEGSSDSSTILSLTASTNEQEVQLLAQQAEDNIQRSRELVEGCFNIVKESSDFRVKSQEIEDNIVKIQEKDLMTDFSPVLLAWSNPEEQPSSEAEALPVYDYSTTGTGSVGVNDIATEVEPGKTDTSISVNIPDAADASYTETATSDEAKAELPEAEKKEAERLEAEKKEAERLEAEKKEAERLEAEKKEAERLEAEKKEAEKSKTTGIDRLEKDSDKDYKHSEDLVYKYNKKMDIEITDEEYEVLCRIVEAEAGDQDIYGRILVANVILNRVRYKKEFANDIIGVVFEKNQFAPTRDGSYYSVTVSKKTKEAVNRATSGEDYSQGALYFFMRSATSKSKASWFDTLDYLFKYGCHEFFK